ncbi:hypothetical protein MCBMB27_01997 [Methylobacterium phyllosphaerae]|uniref:Uncharacterized protein n=1 Tax=Methylobacterium phyllosphaerae TaxID=418223 RepID=A0AAE8HT73_9HYPH|nr:DUF4339 domain-containing protein [Methylobacterium phyllosphaerae]APT31288.1 hypothetical protein MCBMB27_01997 [Methylobacterium phyllosphaerae]SFH10540.1 hypothetical protein SAMN05192567_11412 [Methylobacterium phyllosphaerae]
MTALFSLNYSALSRAVLATRGSLDFEEAAAQAGLDKVAAFFGVARGEAERHLPTVDPAAFATDALLRLVDRTPPAPPEETAMRFYLYRDAVTGPFPLSALVGMARSGALRADTPIHPLGGAWMPAGGQPELAPLFVPAPPDL